MAGREELYLKHIDENTGRIAKALEKLAEARTHSEALYVPVLNTMQLQNWLNGYTATKKDDTHAKYFDENEEYFVCERCLNMFNREIAEKVGMVCPDCNLTLVPLKNVLEEGNDDKDRT